MLCFLSVRRLKPGAFDDFRKAWEPPEWPPEFVRAYHARNVGDENEVVSFGLAEMDRSDLERWRSERADQNRQRQEAMAPFVESVSTDAIFEVIDVVEP
jgi:hypothetical protein